SLPGWRLEWPVASGGRASAPADRAEPRVPPAALAGASLACPARMISRPRLTLDLGRAGFVLGCLAAILAAACASDQTAEADAGGTDRGKADEECSCGEGG